MIATCVLCDTCDESVFTLDHRPARGELVTAAHAAGWTSQYDGRRWVNACDECNAKAAA